MHSHWSLIRHFDVGTEKTLESGSPTEKGKEDSGEDRPEESKEEGTGKPIVHKDENQDGKPLSENVQSGESENKMDDVDANGKPEDNQPASVEAATSQEVSVDESKEVNTSGSQKEADDNSKEADDTIAQKEVENESKEVNDGSSEKEDDSISKEANAGDSQKETGDESKEVNGSGSNEEIGDESKEVNGGSTHKKVDDTQSMTRRIDVPSSKVT